MIIFTTTIVHLVVYGLLSFAFLANAIITRAKSYWFLLTICLLQCGSDIALMAWPGNYSVTAVAVAYGFLLIAIVGITLVSARLLHIWSSSVKIIIPNYPHKLIVWSARVLLGLYGIFAIVAAVAIWLMTQPSQLYMSFKLWYAFMWCYGILTLYMTILSGLVGWKKIRALPTSVDIRRKRNQVIRLFILNFILFLYYFLDGFALMYYVYLQYAGYVLLFAWFCIAAWPRALANYHLAPGQPSPPDSHEGTMMDATAMEEERIDTKHKDATYPQSNANINAVDESVIMETISLDDDDDDDDHNNGKRRQV
ncbi:hypothetical protein BDF22DRAFT_693593 [Syncephalis plumigaleata]|nr:hypothetical protein BDF22DRAFT_693593 [Syncephalis plumigaleata]